MTRPPAGPSPLQVLEQRVTAVCNAIVLHGAYSVEAAAASDALRDYMDGHPGRGSNDLDGLLALPYAGHPDYRSEWTP